jgi:RNA polymerase sigma factor FliA
MAHTTQHMSYALIVVDQTQRERLVIEQIPRVRFIARGIHVRLPRQVLLEDLVHAGIVGLVEAVNKYDPNKNVQLHHYAEFRIRGAILDSLREVDWGPRSLRREGRRVQKVISDYNGRLGRDPTEPEIASGLDINLESLQHLLGELRGLNLLSLQAIEGENKLGDLVAIRTRADDDPLHQLLRSEMTFLLAKAVGEMPRREREVLVLYHYQELTMKEIAIVLGVGESRVSQLHARALPRLRARMYELTQLSVPTCLSESSGH